MIGADTLFLILLLLAGFYMAWNIGANDVSNAMGTSVGSGALTLMKAVVIAGILEFCGAFFLGSNVAETVQKGIVNPDLFTHHPQDFLYGMFSALLATALWLQIASYFGWPVSTTHAIVGAILGFGAIIGGVGAVYWGEIGRIALSWVISPVLSGIFSYLIFSWLQRQVLFAMAPIQAARRLIPYLVSLTFLTFTLSILLHGLSGIHLTLKPGWNLLIALGVGLLSYLTAFLLLRRGPPLRETAANSSQHVYSYNKVIKHLHRITLTSKGEQRDQVEALLQNTRALSEKAREASGYYKRSTDYQVVEKLFATLQLFSACYVAVAHGANDVANAIGPVAACIDILRHGQMSATTSIPPWLLAMGGLGIVIGLATWGWRVMETIGKRITELTPTRGFSAEFGAAVTILLASKLGLPISTTHCIVGAVLGVGMARGLSAINLRTLRDIVLSWIITIPCSALVCILLYYLVKLIF